MNIPATKGIKWDLYLTLIMTLINICGGTIFWFSLPERIRQTKEQLLDHEGRIRVLESDRGLLQRIDERTKSIQDDVKQIHQDFSFSAKARP